MAERTAWFDSVAYNASRWSEVVTGIVDNGYVIGYANQLQVLQDSPSPSLNVRVDLGIYFMNGYFYEIYSAPKTLAVGAGHATLARIDSVIVKLNLSAKTLAAEIKAGTPAGSPVAPTLQQDSSIWEERLANIAVAAGASSIVTANITDLRDPARPRGALVSSGNQTITGQLTITDLFAESAQFSDTANTIRVGGSQGIYIEKGPSNDTIRFKGAGTSTAGEAYVGSGANERKLLHDEDVIDADSLQGFTWPGVLQDRPTGDTTLTTSYAALTGDASLNLNRTGTWLVLGIFDMDRDESSISTITGALFKNGSEVSNDGYAIHRDIGSDGDRGTHPMMWVVSCDGNDTVNLRAKKSGGGTHIIRQEGTKIVAWWIAP